MNEYFLKLTRYEAALIDWVLTLQHWDEPTLKYLLGEVGGYDEIAQSFKKMRLNAGKIIIGDMLEKKEDNFYIPNEEILHFLLCVVPINHKIGDEHCGRTLKEKLYCAYFDVEWKDRNSPEALGAEDYAPSQTPCGPHTCT